MFVDVPEKHFNEVKKLKEGDVVTVKYSGRNVYNKLIQPEFMRERLDMKWDDLVQNKL